MFFLRYHLANGLMKLSLAAMPNRRCQDDLRSLLRAYRKGVTAAVILRELEDLTAFKSDAPRGLKVDTVLGTTPP